MKEFQPLSPPNSIVREIFCSKLGTISNNSSIVALVPWFEQSINRHPTIRAEFGRFVFCHKPNRRVFSFWEKKKTIDAHRRSYADFDSSFLTDDCFSGFDCSKEDLNL